MTIKPVVLTTLLAVGLTALCVSVLLAQGTVRPVTKLFISVDMEGITGVVQPAQLGPTGFEYPQAREWATGEVNAAITAARSAGVKEFVVCDSHGNAQNLLIDKLPEDVRIVRGFPRPLEMMQGIDGSFGGVLLIGYHASEWNVDAVRSHTISSMKLLGIKLNGTFVMEAVFNAAIAGHFGVPVLFVSGDRIAVAELQKTLPQVEGVVVKEPFGFHSAMTVTPARGRQLIGEGVTRALLKASQARPYTLKTPIDLEVGFKFTPDAERAAYIPGLSRVDAHFVRGTFADMPTITKLIQVLTALEPIQ
ncbi:MAG: M55 family metallopeptidase [Acidobacteria bacterium]|nr:M55 family metallopeptidase [Acidobacteriota bacterium]